MEVAEGIDPTYGDTIRLFRSKRFYCPTAEYGEGAAGMIDGVVEVSLSTPF